MPVPSSAQLIIFHAAAHSISKCHSNIMAHESQKWKPVSRVGTEAVVARPAYGLEINRYIAYYCVLSGFATPYF